MIRPTRLRLCPCRCSAMLDETKLLVLAILKIAVEKGPADTVLLKAYLKRAAELADRIKD